MSEEEKKQTHILDSEIIGIIRKANEACYIEKKEEKGDTTRRG